MAILLKRAVFLLSGLENQDPNSENQIPKPIFKPIWRLVSDNGVKVALRDAYGHYAPAASGGGAELMPPRHRAVSHVPRRQGIGVR